MNVTIHNTYRHRYYFYAVVVTITIVIIITTISFLADVCFTLMFLLLIANVLLAPCRYGGHGYE